MFDPFSFLLDTGNSYLIEVLEKSLSNQMWWKFLYLCPAGLHSVPFEFMRIFILPLGCRDQYKILVPREQYYILVPLI